MEDLLKEDHPASVKECSQNLLMIIGFKELVGLGMDGDNR
jgi:hypothetical protein